MTHFTASILMGESHRFHGGLTISPPPRRLWLSENDRPAWLLDGHDGEDMVWQPRGPETILEDGLALLATALEAFAIRRALDVPDGENLPNQNLEDLTDDKYEALIDASRSAFVTHKPKLVLSLFLQTSLPSELRELAEGYDIEVEVLTPEYVRLRPPFGDSIRHFQWSRAELEPSEDT